MNTFTFSGSQGYDPFSIQVVANNKREAIQTILISVNYAIKKGEYHPLIQPLELNIGCYCYELNQFTKPIFTHSGKNIDLEKWLEITDCKSTPFNPKVIRIYSCLDG